MIENPYEGDYENIYEVNSTKEAEKIAFDLLDDIMSPYEGYDYGGFSPDELIDYEIVEE